MIRNILLLLLVFIIIVAGCTQRENEAISIPGEKQPPAEIPEGILVDEVPVNADIIFTSIRYVLSDIACLDDNYALKENFINDPECNRKVYTLAGGLATPRQLFTLDMENGRVVQLTNTDCFYITAQVVNATTIMALAASSDTDDNGLINEQDETELYLIDFINRENGLSYRRSGAGSYKQS